MDGNGCDFNAEESAEGRSTRFIFEYSKQGRDERLTAVNDIVSTKIISRFTICLLMLNKQTVCGILGPREWQEYLRLQKSYLLSCSPATIRSPFDSRTEKNTGPPLPPASPLPFLSPFLLLCLLLRRTSGEAGHRHLSWLDGVNHVGSVAG